MNEIKNLSRKSLRPAMIATKNQKQTGSLTTVSIDGGMYNKVPLRVCQEICIKNLLYICVKNESYIKNYFLMYFLYIRNCFVFGSVNQFWKSFV